MDYGSADKGVFGAQVWVKLADAGQPTPATTRS